jgi:pyridoxamine 5'-phosphate oxidase
MNKFEILEFVNRNPVFFLATADGRTPHVRGLMVYRADEGGILFNTGKYKDLHRQLAANPMVELCFWSREENRQVRISGLVELVDDPELKKQIVEKYTFLKPWVEKQGYDGLAPYRLRHGRATVWTMETNFAPKTYVDF